MLSECIRNIVRSLVGSSIAERDRAFPLEVQAALNRLTLQGLGRSGAVVHVLSELYISEASRRLQLVWSELKRVVTDVGTPYSAKVNDDLTAEFDSHIDVILPLKQPIETQIRNSGFGSDLPDFDSLVKPTIERVHGEIGLFVLSMERNLPAQPEGANAANQVADKVGIPRAFLSHSNQDKQLVTRLAMRLRTRGIDAWLDEWEIKLGDSLRQKIEEGIDKATHFLVILTPDSLPSEWVRTELDAAMVKRIKGTCVLIPVLHRITADQVPATLSGIKWVRIDSDGTGFKELVDAILGVSTKPPLVGAPTAAAELSA